MPNADAPKPATCFRPERLITPLHIAAVNRGPGRAAPLAADAADGTRGGMRDETDGSDSVYFMNRA